ncbi:MFS general substrate transporter [Pleomassaria siparia CBS 279.74]|uniref:MFS general substrate transporter n=1 Tax=Pleomassaria siparia CBS 279.74 TaxID=1314801 RepID=A0A6G1KE57_9PLEO|nr:MFS general substrate transporter [Pleomassaria siparia CBS 279.74]
MSTTTATQTAHEQFAFKPGSSVELRPLGHREPNALVEVTNEESGMSKKNMFKIVASGGTFFFAGSNDGSLGALTPYILRTYNVGTEWVALIYAATFLGWVLVAATNSHTTRYFEMRTILTFGAVLQLGAHLLRFWTPPFGLYVVTFFLQAVGMACNETHANTFVASIKGAHRWLGFIHAMYALGSLVSPFIATSISASGNGRWPLFYVYLVGIGALNTVAVFTAFRGSSNIDTTSLLTGDVEEEASSRNKTASRDIIEALKLPSVYLLSLFYFFMLGVGITAGGWVVEYLVSARNGHLPDVGYVTSGLWGGMFLGRILLAEPTYRFGERKMTMVYCFMILALQLIFWLVPNLVSSAIAICLLGFFFGPFFATGMSVGTKLFDKRIQPTALGFVFVAAQAGGALFPALVGVIASRVGVKVMQPILVGLIVAMGIAWALVPKAPKRDK